MAHPVHDLVRALEGDRNLLPEAVIGVVRDLDDPERLGRVRCEFKFDFQGNVHLAWCMPVFPLGGLIATDPPPVGSPALVFFLDGNPGEPVYVGMTRGRPVRELLSSLSYEGRESLHIVLHEALLENAISFRQWARKHTHNVTVQSTGIGNLGAPVASTGTARTTPPVEPLPRLKKMRAEGIRVHPGTRPEGDEEGA